MSHPEEAVAAFKQGYSCSQSVVLAFAGSMGLEPNMALRVASGFGGGMGRMAETCGAVSGALMVIGMKFGPASSEREARERTYKIVREFAAQFKARHGSLCCRELLGCDISTPDGFKQAHELHLTTSLCPGYVQTAAEILEKLAGE